MNKKVIFGVIAVKTASLYVMAGIIAPNCVIAVKMAFMLVKRQPLCHRERVARGDLYGN